MIRYLRRLWMLHHMWAEFEARYGEKLHTIATDIQNDKTDYEPPETYIRFGQWVFMEWYAQRWNKS